jgi:hypothetical protein
MRLFEETHRLVLKLTPEGYRRTIIAANGLGKGPFVEVALTFALRNNIPPMENHKPSRPLYAYVVTEFKEAPSVLSARLENLVSRLARPEVKPGKQEMIFKLPHLAILRHAEQAVRDNRFPHEALGDSFEQGLRAVVHTLEGVGHKPEVLSAPVERALYDKAAALCRAAGLDFDSVISGEVLEIIRKRL